MSMMFIPEQQVFRNIIFSHGLASFQVAWAPGKGVKGREWKEQWEAELGVSYLPWAALHARWALGDLQLDALEDGGMVDEETLPPWLPPRVSAGSVKRSEAYKHLNLCSSHLVF